MADRVQYNQTSVYQQPYVDGRTDPNDPTDPNNPGSLTNPLTGADPLHLHTFDGVKSQNKFSTSTKSQAGGGDQDTQETAQIFQSAGIPGMGPSQINSAEAKVNADPQLKAGVEQMSSSISQMGDPAKRATASQNLLSAGQQLAQSKNIDIWQLLVVALKGSTRDQNDQLRDDLGQLQMLSKVSNQMSQYSSVLQATQQKLDDKMSSEKDDKKKQNVEVKLNDQRNYEGTDLTHLLADGSVKYSQTADQDPTHQADSDKSHNMVSASGLNVKIQTFTQERDQLQKNIDKRTQKYQSDNEAKNQTVATITATLKNYYEMMSGTVRNTDL